MSSAFHHCFRRSVTHQLRRSFNSTTKHIRRSDFKKQVWVNGKGITYEVDRKDDLYPHPENTANFQWRISQADLVAPGGPFSQIKGVDRILVMLEGDNVSLSVKNSATATTTTKLQLHEPFMFPADVATECTTTESGKDLNIMYNRKTCNGFVSVLSGGSGSATSTAQIPCGTSDAFVIGLGEEAAEIWMDKGGKGKVIEKHTVQPTEAIRFMNPSQKDIIGLGGSGSSKVCFVCFVPSPKYLFDHGTNILK